MANLFKPLAAAVLATAAMPAGAATVVHSFDTTRPTGSTGAGAAYGNALAFSATTDSSLQLRVTGWQSNQKTNAVTRANVVSYGGTGGGLGVTGLGDAGGRFDYHQIDNVLGFTDFVLLQFNRAVTLSGLNANVYQMGGIKPKDSDLAFLNAGVLPAGAWNSPLDLTVYGNVPALWTNVEGGPSSGQRGISGGGASNRWLVGASFLASGGLNDGVKLRSLHVTEQVAPVPEPATWGMMILGFGMIGASLRRRVRRSEERFTDKVRLIAAGQA